MPDVLLATCAELPSGDEDAPLLDDALAALGVTAHWAVWTDDVIDWRNALVVIRSTWDYHGRRDEFTTWASSLPRVANTADVVGWNTDKIYLRDLAAAGVPIVPTVFAPPGDAVELPAGGEFVVKPSVGAGSRGVGRYTPERHDNAQEHVAALHAVGRTVLIQPYLPTVDTAGETALVYLDGEFSHAIRKGPMLPAGMTHPVEGRELFVQENISPRIPAADERAVGDAVLHAIRQRFGAHQLYTRVDLLRGPDGPVVVELELTEPSLFLAYGADGAEPAATFAAAIAARL